MDMAMRQGTGDAKGLRSGDEEFPLQGTADEICPAKDLQALFPSFAEPKALVLFEGVGHFFNNHLAELRKAIIEHRLLLGL